MLVVHEVVKTDQAAYTVVVGDKRSSATLSVERKSSTSLFLNKRKLCLFLFRKESKFVHVCPGLVA